MGYFRKENFLHESWAIQEPYAIIFLGGGVSVLKCPPGLLKITGILQGLLLNLDSEK